MAKSAAVMVLPYMPHEDELEDIALQHLEDLDADKADATVDVVYDPPDWLCVSERDQINAHMRDGGVCIVVIYMEYEDVE